MGSSVIRLLPRAPGSLARTKTPPLLASLLQVMLFPAVSLWFVLFPPHLPPPWVISTVIKLSQVLPSPPGVVFWNALPPPMRVGRGEKGLSEFKAPTLLCYCHLYTRPWVLVELSWMEVPSRPCSLGCYLAGSCLYDLEVRVDLTMGTGLIFKGGKGECFRRWPSLRGRWS